MVKDIVFDCEKRTHKKYKGWLSATFYGVDLDMDQLES